jgi:hypothetical protein
MAIPKGTEIPKGSSQFAKIQDGKNRFRFLSEIVVGWEGWKDKKPFRHEGQVCKIKAEEVDLNQNGKPNINYFWAMVVWNYESKSLQVLEITQKTIMSPLYDLEQNPDWGDLRNYDIEINKKKEGDKTSYNVLGIPPKPLAPEIIELYSKTDIDLKKLFDGKYPMTEEKSDEVNSEDIPF